VPAFLHFSLVPTYHTRVPQPALLLLVAALCVLAVRMVQHRRTTESGMFWSLAAVWLGLQSGGLAVKDTAYFGIAGLALASSIIENSYSLAYQDELTRLPSRRAFNDALLRLKHPFTIAAVDIDHFKSVNDTYGHDTGDQVLRMVGSRLERVSGGGEAFRVGGEEFTVLFPNRSAQDVTDHLELLRLDIENSSFRLRSGDERRKLSRTADRRAPAAKRTATRHASNAPNAPNAQSLSVTVSIGIAESLPKKTVEDVIQVADKALYRAKQGGRNRIEIAIAQPKPIRARKLKGPAPG
jgi:diguanylate cyclase (GGDEF)-like protein